jgi:hypothetical protein
MSLEKRIQKLEQRYRGEDDGMLTWEEYCYFVGTVCPERRNDRSELVDMPRILASPPTPKVRRMLADYRAKKTPAEPQPAQPTQPESEGR